jgi:hypothetical protein
VVARARFFLADAGAGADEWGAKGGMAGLNCGTRFAQDSLLEGEGFEFSVPGQRISVYRVIRSVACEG